MADRNKLYVHIIKIGENKFELSALSIDNYIWFHVPEELKDLALHKELLTIKAVGNSMNSIKKFGGYRKISVPYNSELKQKYMDEDENFCISNHYLEECVEEGENASKVGDETTREIFLIKRIKELESRILFANEISLNEVEKKFLLKKFDGNQEASAWIHAFEKECIRFNIAAGSTRVEALKLFIGGNVTEWYSSNLMKLTSTDWESWKNSFLLVYGKIGWAPIRVAFNYKYMYGSLIDFVLKKERLLLEADKDMPEIFRIYQIVYNLPLEVQEKLEREKIKTLNDLLRELKKFSESYVVKKKFVKTYDIERIPCSICESLGFKNRYHSIKICRNKSMQFKHKINLNKLEECNEDDTFKINMIQEDNESKN